MEKWILVVYTNCTDPTKEAEFNSWYDNIHVPDILETPGILNANRYLNNGSDESTGKFVAIYEIQTEDIETTMTALKDNIGKKTEQGRVSRLVQVVSSTRYKQISSTRR